MAVLSGTSSLGSMAPCPCFSILPPLFSSHCLWTSSICFSVHGCRTTHNVTLPSLAYETKRPWLCTSSPDSGSEDGTDPAQLRSASPIVSSGLQGVGTNGQEGSVSKHILFFLLFWTHIFLKKKKKKAEFLSLLPLSWWEKMWAVVVIFAWIGLA